MRWFPNFLSLSRVFLAPVIGWMILNKHPWAWTIFFWVSWTDVLDGWLARKMGVDSQLGAYLDPLGDKVWVMLATLAWWKMGRIPDFLMALILGRDLMILFGSAYVYRQTGQKDFAPSKSGKVSTVIQLTMLAGCFTLSDGWLHLLQGATILGTVLSGMDYVRAGMRMLKSRQ
ncbi:MAG: CDP-alcohol phosphatidyltransferase family protein [Acidobacteria bacterium]|nr:CDP-alcohol phosphatidyltransferase family protein [Acidobacteriota bacterium]